MFHKTELLKISVEDLDGETIIPDAPVNLLRQKTFNPELSSLLNKIYSHEKIDVADSPVTEVYDPVTKLSLLKKCDDILYRLKHKIDAASVTSKFNPFSLDINVYDDIDDLKDYIQVGMRQIGFSRFAVMKYIFRDSAFRTDLNMINQRLTTDLFFSIKDPLFNELQEKHDGCIIDNQAIIDDPFMNKKLGYLINSESSKRTIYFIRLCSFFNDQENELICDNISSIEQYLSPILVVIPDDESLAYEPSTFYNRIKTNMIIPFSIYLMKNRFSFSAAGLTHEDALLMLELLMNSPAGKNMTRTILIFNDYSVKENIFILKYLISRIRKRLEKNSFFMRISIDKSVLIASEEEKKDIISMIDEINATQSIISMESADKGINIDRNKFATLFL